MCAQMKGRPGPASYTPRHLAERILTQRGALEGERKQVTVLFADVVDSTILAGRVDAEQWHRILDGLFRILAEEVHRFEGTINQYTGDGIMALFGAPLAHEDHARRAAYAALQIADRLEDYAAELARRGLRFALRMGLNSGEVVVGKIGDDLRMDYTAQGLAVALASRIEELAEPGQICCSAETAELLEGLVALEELGTRDLKGFPDPVRIFELVGGDFTRTPLDVAVERGLSRLVGRGDTLAELRSRLDEVVPGNGQVVQIWGEPGVGKSRLLLEFASHCRAQGIPVYQATCPSHGRGVPLLLLRALLRSAFNVASDDADDIARSKIEHRLARLGLPSGLLPVALELLEVHAADTPAPSPDVERERYRVHLVRRLVQGQSAEQAAVFVVDDLQWLDAESARLLGEMIEALGWTRTLLVLASRPGTPSLAAETSYGSELWLAPLEPPQARELLRALLGDDPSLGRLPEQIAEQTGGNPFFIEEIVRDLVRSGTLSGEHGEYRLLQSGGPLPIPASVRSLLQARIDQLAEREKLLLRVGSVIGEFSEPALLAGAAGIEEHELEAELLRLDRQGLVVRSHFAHPLIREVAYTSQLLELRRELHARVARTLEQVHADELGKKAALIAHHWEQADRSWIARRWRHRAALRVASIQLSRPRA